jgi:hypothetical protein
MNKWLISLVLVFCVFSAKAYSVEPANDVASAQQTNKDDAKKATKDKSKDKKAAEKSGPKIDWKTQLPDKTKVAAYLQDISVTIKTGFSEGSGVVKTRTVRVDGKDVKINFVWTAAHVVDGLRTIKEVIDPKTGTKRQLVEFKDAQVVKELVENGRRVGELKMDATVIRFNKEEDLAILRIRKSDFVHASVIFYLDEKIPAIGTDVLHCGSLLGQMGSNSLTSGIVSQIGRTIDKQEYDQSTATAFPGSSGGGIYLKNDYPGAYCGMLVRGAGEGFNLFVPIRRLVAWAKKAEVMWAVDDNVAMPDEEELKKVRVEDIGVEFEKVGNADSPKPIHPPGTPAAHESTHTLIKDAAVNPDPRTMQAEPKDQRPQALTPYFPSYK